ncbi:transposase [Furfurilactobacillus milii]|uniref:transposase n=1 Tax=Furfurilactobacillus milii TaxID=2888272 RepID=UPI003D64837A
MAVFIKQAFVQFRELVHQAGLVNYDALFIDGTKLLTNANKYTFVWKKNITKYNNKLTEKTRALYDEPIQNEVDLAIDQERYTPTNVDQMKIVTNQLDDKIAQLDQAIETEKSQPGGSPAKQRRRHLKKFQRQLARKTNYDEALATFGNRNSYSKTDHDATFMRMKEDPNGQLKPGYNLQIVTQHQFTHYYDLYQRPTDTRTLVPFLKIFDFDATPVKYIVADAGYGSESNYEYITDELDKQYLIPYGMYEKEKKKRYRNDPTKIQNWQYDEKNDVFTDYQGIEFHFKNYSIRHDQYGQERKFKVYQAVDYFEDPVRQALAQTPSGRQRQVSINNNWLYFKNYARVQLQSDEGKKIYGQRKIEVEPVFADVKAHLRFTRFSVRGLDKVNNEVGLVLMAMNMIKWAREKVCLITKIQENQGNEKIDQRKAKITFLWSIYFELCPKLVLFLSLT